MSEENKGFLNILFRFPVLIVIIILSITVFFAFQLPKAELDNNNIRFIPDDDEARLTSKYIDNTFGSSLFILVALERQYGDVFDAAFLNRIREFNNRMEDFEIVGEINSIVSSDYIFSEGDSIVVKKLIEDGFSGTEGEITQLKQKLLSWDIYRRSLISDDFRATQILIPLTITTEQSSNKESIDSFIEIRDLAKEMFSGYADVYVTGLPLISAVINESMKDDLKTMIPMVTLVVLLVLFFSFRRFTYVILPLISVFIAAIWSIGAMPLFGIKLSVISTVLPVILVAVGSAYGIHMVTHYIADMKNKTEISREEHRSLVLSLLRRIGKAVSLAALTTLAGFSSFCFTSVLPIREFGFFSTFGVLVAFLTAVTLIPALLILRGPGKKVIDAKNNPSSIFSGVDNAIAGFFTSISKKKGAIIFTALIITIFSVLGVSRIIIDNVFVEYFKASTDISKSDRFIREKFGGSKIVSVVVEAENTETLLMPDVLIAMDSLGTYLEDYVSEVGKVLGFTDLVKRINQVFNADESPNGIKSGNNVFNDNFGFEDFGFEVPTEFGFNDFGFGEFDIQDSEPPAFDNSKEVQAGNEITLLDADQLMQLLHEAASRGMNRGMDSDELIREMEKLLNFEGAAYYEIPSSPERYGKTRPEELQQLIANYLILLSGNISSYANDPLEPTAIKSTIQLKTLGNEDTGRVIGKIQQFIEDRFPDSITTLVGGSALVEDSLNHLVVESQIISVIISILIVFFIITISYRSIIAGAIGIAPLSICLLINFAVMGFAGIKLNIGTSMVASVSVGIGIDYTIHYIEAYKREYLSAKGKGGFIFNTFASSGKAILINAISVGAGFAVLHFSQFIMLKHLGLLIALTMCSSAIVSLTVIPVLLSLIDPKFIRRVL